jgi:hypothetical protein
MWTRRNTTTTTAAAAADARAHLDARRDSSIPIADASLTISSSWCWCDRVWKRLAVGRPRPTTREATTPRRSSSKTVSGEDTREPQRPRTSTAGSTASSKRWRSIEHVRRRNEEIIKKAQSARMGQLAKTSTCEKRPCMRLAQLWSAYNNTARKAASTSKNMILVRVIVGSS